jgi:hypothetical protein
LAEEWLVQELVGAVVVRAALSAQVALLALVSQVQDLVLGLA